MENNSNKLKLKRLGIDTHNEYVVYMRSDCHICISEGFEALTRLEVTVNDKTIIASLHVIKNSILSHGEAGLSEKAWEKLDAMEGDQASFSHLHPVASMSEVRAKMYGNTLKEDAFYRILKDIIAGKYSNIELSAFITACAGDNLNIEEITGLTQAMINTGTKLHWNNNLIVDKHCVGGLPGNRTTPIVVAIISAAGLTIPKTSSRAITSPAGTADTMEVITPVKLDLRHMQQVVIDEGGCFVWGGAVKLSPADDILIKIEKALDVDSEGQMIASVLSKKAAAGSTHVVIDIPVGETAKVRSIEDALKLKYYFTVVGKAIGLKVKVLITDGSQPVGKGIGPALEARDIIDVLRNKPEGPTDLKVRAIEIAGKILEIANQVKPGEGLQMAAEIIDSGKAWEKFLAICNAQGGFQEPQLAKFKHQIIASQSGTVTKVDNRKLAKVAKLAGAPKDPAAGVLYQTSIGEKVEEGQTLYTIYAESEGELRYALRYVETQPNNIITINNR